MVNLAFIQVTAVAVLFWTLTACRSEEYPKCGDCWCIPRDGKPSLCPSNAPVSHFSDETIRLFQQPSPAWVYTLTCNPYSNSSCTTEPLQIELETDSAVCGFVDWDCSTYSMQTFKSREDADLAEARITHKGSCGLCSTAQDLSIYLREDFTTEGKKCASLALLDEQVGLMCYQEIGLTEECARIWNYDGIFDASACGKTCAGSLTASNNGPPPMCELNDCLACDETEAGPVFSSFAARTRRRSGLVSEIIRDCESIAKDIVHDPTCP